MSFANLELLREISPFSKNEVTNERIIPLIPMADTIIIQSFAKKHYLERLDGNIDGTNTIFYTRFAPIANITGSKRTIIDACDATTGWSSGNSGGAIATEATKKRESTNSLRIPKDSGTTIASFSKNITARSFRNETLFILFYIDDKIAFDKLRRNAEDIQIRLYDGTDYFQYNFGKQIDNSGWHTFVCTPEQPSLQSGTPNIDEIDKIYIHYTTNLTTDTTTNDDIIMDYWYADAMSIDHNDVKLYYVTQDANNREILGNPKSVSSVDAQGGRITMATAPTQTTASEGVFATYYATIPDLEHNLIRLAATYMLAHFASIIVSGRSPNYVEIRQGFLRRETYGNENQFLKLALEVIQTAIGYSDGGVGFRNTKARKPYYENAHSSKCHPTLGEIDKYERGDY